MKTIIVTDHRSVLNAEEISIKDEHNYFPLKNIEMAVRYLAQYKMKLVNGKVPDERLPVFPDIYVDIEMKGQPGGIATLNNNGKIPNSQINIDEITGYTDSSVIGEPNGIVSVNEYGYIPSENLNITGYTSKNVLNQPNGIAISDSNNKVQINNINTNYYVNENMINQPNGILPLTHGVFNPDKVNNDVYIFNTEKGVGNGIATLDSTTKIPKLQLDISEYLLKSTIGQPNGVAPLNSEGYIPTNYINTSEMEGAPDGFGLGEYARKVTNNWSTDAVLNGWYYSDSSVYNLPPDAFSGRPYLGYVSRSGKYISQTIYNVIYSNYNVPITFIKYERYGTITNDVITFSDDFKFSNINGGNLILVRNYYKSSIFVPSFYEYDLKSTDNLISVSGVSNGKTTISNGYKTYNGYMKRIKYLKGYNPEFHVT